MKSDRRLLNIKDAADYLGGISTLSIRGLVSDNVLTPVRIPSTRNPGAPSRRLLFDRNDLDRLIDQWKAAPNESLSRAAIKRWAVR